jgi:hypothetical protein
VRIPYFHKDDDDILGRNPLLKKIDLQGAGGKHTYYPSPEQEK